MFKAPILDPLTAIAKRLTGRSMVLSHPRCGRSWIPNISLNSWWCVEINGQEPLPFCQLRNGALELAQPTNMLPTWRKPEDLAEI